MGLYTYRMRDGETSERHTRYYRRELEQLTTLQLRDICQKERLVWGVAQKLDRRALVELIMRFRGIDESAFIKDYDEENWDRLQRNIKRFLTTEIQHDGRIQIPARMICFEDLAITAHDRYRIVTGGRILESNALLVDDEMNLYGILNIKRFHDEYYLTAADGMIAGRQQRVKHYNLLFFAQHESSQLFDVYYGRSKFLPAQIKYYKVVAPDLRIEQLTETAMMLCIDFGSSNTSCGAYLERSYVPYLTPVEMEAFDLKADRINIVRFDGPGVATEDRAERALRTRDFVDLLPSSIAVKDCSIKEQIVYRFGHDALEYLSGCGYNTRASHFHEMKRWVNNIDQVEELVDEKDQVTYVSRKEILQAFFHYVIHSAQQQFKCIFKTVHLSSPVRLQPQFMQMFQSVLGDYTLIVDEALDEGISVLYNSISDLIDRESYEPLNAYQALILDCGGSTTDLSSCTFSIENGRIAYDVEIQTTFENGNINFGGNNLTYRILQYIKVLFAQYYREGKVSFCLKDLLAADTFTAYRYLDDQGLSAYYAKLEEAYLQAEQIIPTRFAEYRSAPQSEYDAVHSNFYFLWFVAEQLKRTFFEAEDIYRSSFHSLGVKNDEYDLKVTPFEPWAIRVRKATDSALLPIYEYPKIIFNAEEIRHLLLGDVYCCMRSFLQPFYDDGSIDDTQMIRMVGQSVKVDSFKDSVKEFVPGKRIRFSRKMIDSQSLKLSCLKGAISYLNDKRMGRVDAVINNALPVTPYEVTACKHDGQELTMISSLERLTRSAGFVSRNINTKEIEFMLKDADENILYRYQMETDFDEYEETTYTIVNTTLSDRIRQDDVDTIQDREIKFFVFAYASWWGFYVLPIARNEGLLYAGERRFFSFENERWEKDFFDGFQ